MNKAFTGYPCKNWTKGVKMSTFFIWSMDTVFYDVAIIAKQTECWKLVQTKECGGQSMATEGNVWKYELPRYRNWRYWNTVHTKVLRCMYDGVSLTQLPGMDHIYAYKWKLADRKSESFAVIHWTTFVWPFTTIIVEKCVLESLTSNSRQQSFLRWTVYPYNDHRNRCSSELLKEHGAIRQMFKLLQMTVLVIRHY